MANTSYQALRVPFPDKSTRNLAALHMLARDFAWNEARFGKQFSLPTKERLLKDVEDAYDGWLKYLQHYNSKEGPQ